MKVFQNIGHGIVRLWMVALAGSLMLGCSSVQKNDPVNPQHPFVFPGQAQAAPAPSPVISAPAPLATTPAPVVSLPATPVSAAPTEAQPVAPVKSSPGAMPGRLAAAVGDAVHSVLLAPGDNLIVSFSDLPPNYSLPPVQVELGADGKITLHNNVQVYALGKTPRQLEQEIRTEYVPRIYRYLTVTIKTEVRWFHVTGEVKMPNQIPWRGQMTVLKAIAAAGGFTDWAKITRVQLTRVTGQKFIVNCKEALKKPEKDLPVYPGDLVDVPRKGFLGF